MHVTRLLRGSDIAAGTMAFHFEKPAGFKFKAGQALDLVLPQAADAGEDSTRHTFSIVSGPSEDDLVIATRMRDTPFKRALKSLPAGAAAHVEGPFGSLLLHKDATRPAVFIAGGIGITPFISMLRQAASEHANRQLVLLYSNRRPEDAAFLAELQQYEQQHPRFRLVATMTQMGDAAGPWGGPTGQIDAAVVERACGDLSAPIYYVAGPPALVAAMRDMLEGAGVADTDIRSEDFFGY